MKKFYSAQILLSFLMMIISNSVIFSQDTDAPEKKENRRMKIMGFADEGVGVQTKGQLQNLTMNYGQVSDTRFEDVGNAPTDVFFDIRYPREHFTGLVDDFSIFFAIKENSQNGDQGNVIDAWTDNDNEDFTAKDGSYGKTHYNPALDPSPHDVLLYNGQTPYLAHSDLVNTWPVDEEGNPFWPGIFRRNPQTGEQVPDEFASDRDIYMEYTDANNQQGDVVGIEIHEMAYTYGRVYAEDALFYEFWIINKSGKDLKGCYTGFYQDPDCSDYGQEILLLRDSTFEDNSNVFSIAQRDFDGDIGGATVPNSLGITEDYTFGTIFLETPYNMGVTDFHYFTDPGPTDDRRLWAIISSDPTNPNILAEAGNFFHGANKRIDDVSLITVKEDLVWIAATGPFDIDAGDTVKMTIAVVAGDDDADYYSNLWAAKELYDAKFNGPIAPPSPSLSAVAGDGRITLYWNDSPENFIDPSTNEADFEGYKIFRSEDGGTTWGTKITDSQGRTFGYVPTAQFDLVDNIKGNDPINPLIWLGSDNGLRHNWVDSNVVNGIAYSYTIVSYDKGTPTLYSLEGTKGDGPQVNYFVTVTPKPDATGKIPSKVKTFTHTKGTGTGVIDIEIIDDNSLKTSPYKITFEGNPAKQFSITRLDQNNTIIYDSRDITDIDHPVIDGFRVKVSSDNKIGGIKSITDGNGKNVEGPTNISSDTSWYISASLFTQADTASKSASYSIRFTEEESIAYSWGLSGSVAKYSVPFTIWNTNTDHKVCFEILDANNNNQWDEGETIFITRIPYPDPAPSVGDPNPAMNAYEFAYQVSILNTPLDTLKRPPSLGTIINITCYNALTEKDVYAFEFSQTQFDAKDADLSQIRVVPNPYIVTSKYESLQNVREIQFMYLPPECDIYIYTVAGTLVKTIHHNDGEGSLSWNLLTDWNQALAFGVYIYVVEDPYGNIHRGKFALIK